MKRLFSAISFLMLISAIAWGEASFTVVPPRQVIAGNKFNVTFRLKDGEGNALKVSEIDGCTLLYGPSTSTMNSYQVINGNATSSTTVDYSYVYRADKAGTFTIPSASIMVGGRTLRTEPVSFKVLPADDSSSQGGGNGSGVRVDDISSQTPDKQISAKDVFVRIILNKSQAYEQEAIECTLKLYTKYQINSFMAKSQPSFEGFLINEVDVQAQLNEIEHFNGQNYMTAVLKKCIIYPQKSGRLTINSGMYDITVVQYERVNRGFFTTSVPVERDIHVRPGDIAVNILPLPQPQPDGFTGAVGNFTLDSRLTSSSLRTGEAASLIYVVSGTGNIKYIHEPDVQLPDEFEQYTPKTDINARVVGSNMSGSVTWEYTFVPQSVGDFTIPASSLVYFNPSSREYVTLDVPERHITVSKGSGTTTTVEQQAITAKNNDILHIKLGDKNLSRSHTVIITQAWYWIIYVVLIIGLAAAVFFYSRYNRLHSDITRRRMAGAGKVARRRLRLARKLMDSGDNEKFYQEILSALQGYVSDKLNIPASRLLRDNIADELRAYGAPEELITEVIAILDDCDMARYAPSASSASSMKEIFDRTSSVMERLQDVRPARSK